MVSPRGSHRLTLGEPLGSRLEVRFPTLPKSGDFLQQLESRTCEKGRLLHSGLPGWGTFYVTRRCVELLMSVNTCHK
eukprot:3833951-Amphidinium_carterae.1